MDNRIKDLLKPEILSTLNGLELIARILVEGFMTGSNKSEVIGTGQEFSQYRNYEPGDDLRQLDWKMFARSERYYIKQSEIETNITVKFIIDASHSMAYEEEGLSKLQFAKILSAALAYLARKQGDTFGLYAVNDKRVLRVHPKFEQQQFMRFLHALTGLTAEGIWNQYDVEQLLHHHNKEMMIFISDLYDDASALLNFVSQLKTSRNEVIVLHLMGQHEMDLDYDASVSFQDLETRAVVKVNTLAQRRAYTEKMKHWSEQLRLTFLEKSIQYALINTGDPIDRVLRAFLQGRKRLTN